MRSIEVAALHWHMECQRYGADTGEEPVNLGLLEREDNLKVGGDCILTLLEIAS